MDKSLILGILNDWNYWKKDLPAGIARPFFGEKISQKAKTMEIIVIKGIRRCGKSTLLRQIMKNTKKFNYFNFEDPRATSFKISDYELLNEVFEEENGQCEYYYFDEIQNLDKWERYIRKLLDDGKKCIVTGSNVSLLSKELGTKLTGRHLTYKLFPFSYHEMLKLLSLKPSVKSFDKYFLTGGIPDYLKYDKNEFLQELFDDVIYKDIIVRHKLREVKPVKNLALFLLTNIGKEFSYNKIAKYLNMGSVHTVISYIDFFEDSYLLFTVPKFDYSYKKQIVNPKKIYCIDNGLLNAVSFKFSDDFGKLLENVVFIELRRRNEQTYYYRNKYECDFIIVRKNKVSSAIQVTKKISDENEKREMNGILEAMKEYKLNEGIILTEEKEKEITIEGKKIKIIPIWKWLLEKSDRFK